MDYFNDTYIDLRWFQWLMQNKATCVIHTARWDHLWETIRHPKTLKRGDTTWLTQATLYHLIRAQWETMDLWEMLSIISMMKQIGQWKRAREISFSSLPWPHQPFLLRSILKWGKTCNQDVPTLDPNPATTSKTLNQVASTLRLVNPIAQIVSINSMST